jgi:hypothetical protein
MQIAALSGWTSEQRHVVAASFDGPRSARVVVGQNGETYSTPDHYRTFTRVYY